MGFVVRTASVTVGFDLIAAKHLPGFDLPDDLMRRLVAQCDVLFISHTHWDHADPALAELFLDRGKPVVGPPDLWAGAPINARLTRLRRQPLLQQPVPVRAGRRTLHVIANPGFQNLKTGENVTNDVYVVGTPEGLVIAHTGDDNTFKPAGFTWVDPDHPQPHQGVDVLLLNDWTLQVPRTLRGYDPRLVVGGHFDELGHENVFARAPYWRGLLHAHKSPVPWLVMTWGESFDYDRRAFPAGTAAAAKQDP